MWTKKGKYGLKALLHLAALPPGTSALSSEIATAHALPSKFLEAILLELKNASFIRSRKGKGGGYTMAVTSSEVRIGEVVRASKDRLRRSPARPAISIDGATTVRTKRCAIHLLTVDVRNAIADVMDSTTLADMIIRLERSDVAPADP